MALITAIGDSVNRMIPPLIVTKKQIDELMIIMKAAIADRRSRKIRRARNLQAKMQVSIPDTDDRLEDLLHYYNRH